MNRPRVAQASACSAGLSRCLLVLFLAATSLFALDITKLKPTGYVNDFAHAIDPASAQRLTAYCGILERATGAQIAVVTVDTLDGDDVADVANRLYHQWGIGKKPNDEGVLIFFSIKDKKDRAEIGYGLEPVITDADAGSIMRARHARLAATTTPDRRRRPPGGPAPRPGRLDRRNLAAAWDASRA